jgi:hypothetical protein
MTKRQSTKGITVKIPLDILLEKKLKLNAESGIEEK